jgi:hypothetical protein
MCVGGKAETAGGVFQVRAPGHRWWPSGSPWSSGSRSGSTAVWCGRPPRRVFQRLLPEQPTPERCIEAYYLQRTRCESIDERKLRWRQLTEDGNVEISGRDVREVCQIAAFSIPIVLTSRDKPGARAPAAKAAGPLCTPPRAPQP